MSSLSQQQIVKIAHLSKLSLDEQEIEILTEDFNRILGFVEQIQKVNTDSVKVFAHQEADTNVARADVAASSLPISEVEKLTSHFQDGFFVVPKVIDAE